jgi:hypothetical protein
MEVKSNLGLEDTNLYVVCGLLRCLFKLTTCRTLLEDLTRCVERLCDLSDSIQIVISLHTKQGPAARVREFMDARKLGSTGAELPTMKQATSTKYGGEPNPLLSIAQDCVCSLSMAAAYEGFQRSTY